jgi:hypothetical protein
MRMLNKWATHNCLPVTEALVGRRVRHAYDANRWGIVQSVEPESGMMRVWWDGLRCPGYGPTEATAPENVEVVRVL